MANGYETPAEDAADTAPESPAEDAGEGKASQQQVNYRMGNPQRSCGLCADFDSARHACNTVGGDISAYGFCDIYQRQDNPFLAGTQEGFDTESPAEDAAPGDAAEDAPPPPAAGTAPPPTVMIGRKTYQ